MDRPPVIPGIFIAQGMGIRVSGLSLSIDAAGEVTSRIDPIQTRTDVTAVWLDAAIDRLFDAERSLKTLLGLSDDRSNQIGKVMHNVMQSSMQTITACGICTDAYQSSLFELINISQDIKARWKSNRTPVYKRTAHIIGRAYRLPNAKVKEIRLLLKEHTKFRDWAVHPTHEFQEAILNQETGRSSDWRFAAFNCRNARTICRSTLQLISSCSELNKPNLSDEILEHSKNLRNHLVPVIKKWKRRFGDLYSIES